MRELEDLNVKPEPYFSHVIPMVKITPGRIVGYYQTITNRPRVWQNRLFTGVIRSEEQERNFQRLQEQDRIQKAYTGEMTPFAQKKLKEAAEILFALARRKKVEMPKKGIKFTYRIGFITLTLSGKQGTITDREIKKDLLEPFLRHFRAKGMINYIWKAERQQNGNIHFHILTDAWVDKDHLTEYWNKLQAKKGFIEQFFGKYGHRNPPSTQVKPVKTQKGMVNYLLKYMVKEVDKSKQLEVGRGIEKEDIGKIWDCSLHLKLKNNTAEPIEDHQFELLEKAVDSGKFNTWSNEYCTLYFPKSEQIWNIAPHFLAQRIIKFMTEVRNKGRSTKPERKERENTRLIGEEYHTC